MNLSSLLEARLWKSLDTIRWARAKRHEEREAPAEARKRGFKEVTKLITQSARNQAGKLAKEEQRRRGNTQRIPHKWSSISQPENLPKPQIAQKRAQFVPDPDPQPNLHTRETWKTSQRSYSNSKKKLSQGLQTRSPLSFPTGATQRLNHKRAAMRRTWQTRSIWRSLRTLRQWGMKTSRRSIQLDSRALVSKVLKTRPG